VAGVFSTQFISGATAVPLKYTVPAGQLAVIKCIVGVNTGTVADLISVDIGGIYIWIGSVPGASVLTASSLMVVAKSGQVITASGGSKFHLTVSGFLLNNLPGR
jgi:hypothetical protein